MLETLFATVTEAIIGYAVCLLQESGPADRVRAILGADPEHRAFQTALARTYAAFARQYPDLAASLFDETFLKTEAAPLLAQLLTRRGHPDPAELARLWAAHLGHSNPESWPRLAEATCAAADFLRWLEAELAKQPALQPLWDSRALERIAENTEAIRRIIEEAKEVWPRMLKEANRYVEVVEHKDHYLITGNRSAVNQVFQRYFGGDYKPLSDLYLPPDPVFRRVLLENFVGRDWLEAELDRFLTENECGVWLLVGEAGVGKTTFLAHLVQERRYLHFFAEQAPGEAGVTRALQSLAAQLVARYRLEPYASRGALSPSQAAYPDFLERLLHMAADRLAAGERLVIVADALDEAGAGPNGNILGLPKVLPKGVFLILSQRPVAVPLRVNPYPVRADLQAKDARNLADMEAYLRGVARHPAVAERLRARNYSEEDFVRALREKSAGNWMYLHYVVAEIREGRRHPLDLEGLPVGLVGYYAEYWGRWWEKPDWDSLYAPLLAALAATREPVSLDMLARWAGLEADYRLKRLLEEHWAPFLYRTGSVYRLYHASLRDFLNGEVAKEGLTPADRALVAEMAERTREAHRRIADQYTRLAEGDWLRLSGVDGGYGLRHLAGHLAGAGEWERLHELVAEGEECQPWAEARHGAEGNYEGYLSDLHLVWQRAVEEGERDPKAVGKQVRYALIEASIHSLAGNIPPELLVALVEKGVWTPPAALAHIHQIPDERQRAKALTGLAPHLPEDLLQEALATAREIRDEETRAQTLAGLAPYLPEGLLQKALIAAGQIRDEEIRARTLARLAPYLPEGLLQKALIAVREIDDEPARVRALATLMFRLAQLGHYNEALTTATEIGNELARTVALAELASYLPEPLRDETLQKAIAIAGGIQDVDRRDLALASLAPRLAELGCPEESMAVARGIADNTLYSEAIVELTPYLPRDLLPNVLTTVREILSEYERAEALATLAPYLSEDLARETLAAAREIQDPSARVEVLTALAPCLPADVREQALQEALDAFWEIGDIRAEIWANLVSHLPENLLRDALAFARRALDVSARAVALAILAPRLQDDLRKRVVGEALAAARGIWQANKRAETLVKIVPCLLEDLREQALQEALVALREIENKSDRIRILVDIAPYLPENLLLEAWTTAREIGLTSERIKAITGLAPYLSGHWQEQALREALAATLRISDKSTHAGFLSMLIPYLSGNLLRETLAAVKEIGDKSARAKALAQISSHLPEDLRRETLDSVKGIQNANDRAEALAVLAPHLPESLRQEALSVALGIRWEPARVRALSALIPYLPGNLREQALQETLVAAQEIRDENSRAEALASISSHLSKLGRYEEARAIVRKIRDNHHRAKALAELALGLVQQGCYEAALTTAREIRDEFNRVRTLSGLVLYLPKGQQEQVWQEILTTVKKIIAEIRDEYTHANALVKLTLYVPGDLWEYSLWEILAELLSHFPEDLREQALQEAMAAAMEIGDEFARAEATTMLASHLPESLREQVLQEALAIARSIEDESARTEALARLAPHLPEDLREQTLREALAAAREIVNEDIRAEALAGLAPHLAEVPRPALYALWAETLPVLARRTRQDLLSDIRALEPVIHALGGEAAVVETFCAIQDVGRWWP